MKQIFLKSIEGHQLQFCRLLYPIRYSVLVKTPQFRGSAFIINKKGKGQWEVESSADVPNWFYEIDQEIYKVITENEANPEIID